VLVRNIEINKNVLIISIISVIFFKIYCWAAILNITPDSASYISTTNHFASTGKFINITNWPSMTLLPIEEAFTDCAPGLPLLLSPILKIVNEPLIAAFVLQSIFLVLFFYYLFKLFEILELKSYSILSGVLLIAFFPMTSKGLYSFYAELPLVVTIFASLYYSLKMSNKNSNNRDFYYLAISLLLGSSFKYIGVFSLGFVLIFLLNNKELTSKMKIKLALLFAFSGTIPIIVWFARNNYLYGYTTYSHKVGKSIDFNVFDSFLSKLGVMNKYLPIVVIISFVFFMLLTLLPIIYKKLSLTKNTYLGLYLAFIVNFGGIIFLSMISDFNELGPRLMFPSIVTLFVCFIFVMDKLITIKYSKSLFGLIFLISILFTYNQTKALHKLPINLPLEKNISSNIMQNKDLAIATHYYSEFDNYLLQLYINKPIRFIMDSYFDFSDTVEIRKLKETGINPFFVFSDTSLKNKQINPLVVSGTMEKIHFKEYKTSIYKFRN